MPMDFAAAGADFSLDAFLAVNTGEEEATITSDTNPDAAPIVIPGDKPPWSVRRTHDSRAANHP
jgi:hypothetical protein